MSEANTKAGKRPWLAYEELSMPQIAAIDKDRAVALIAIGPIEEHGPHLPVGVDAFNAEIIADVTAQIIRGLAPETTVVKLPTLYLGAHVYRSGGSVWVRQRVVRNTVVDWGRALAQAGFKKSIVISAHGGPRHWVALEEAAQIVSRRTSGRMIALTSRLIFDFLNGKYVGAINEQLATPLTKEEIRTLTMDYHAGWWETSMMLRHKPQLVDPGYVELPASLLPRHKLRPNCAFTQGVGKGYLGAPARATAAFADATAEALSPEITRIIREFLADTLAWKSIRSPIYFLPVFRTNYKLYLAGMGLALAVVIWGIFLLLR